MAMTKKTVKKTTEREAIALNEAEKLLADICGLMPDEIARCAAYRLATNQLAWLTTLADQHEYEVSDLEFQLAEELELHVGGTLGMYR